jgi:hypothetical protein
MIELVSSAKEAWREHLSEILSTRFSMDEALLDHVVEGLAFFCAHTQVVTLTKRDIALLSARALDAIGHSDEAKRVLDLDETLSPFASYWLDSFELIDQFAVLLPLFSNGIITPGAWSGWQKRGMWILDFNQIAVREEELHEVTLLKSLQLLIRNMSPLWHSVSGEGMLGLRGVKQARSDRLAVIRTLGSASEVEAYVKAVLKHEQVNNQWIASPEIVVM